MSKLAWLSLLAISGCSNIPYYAQSVSGQSEILFKQQSITELLEQDIEPDLKQKLQLTQDLLGFAEQELNLPSNGSYSSYVDLQRPFVIWNVFAAPELSLEPKSWCYLIVGCLAYRGYFDQQDAESQAASLSEQGYDVYVGGVAAYSTLGWFNDPVLNTMLRYDDLQLAKIIFHELAHQKFYVNDDSEFNEAFADTVAVIGLQRWLDQLGQPERYQKLERQQQYEEQFVELLLQYKKRLESLFQSGQTDQVKRQQKQQIYQQFKQDYKLLSENWDGYRGFDSWYNKPVNNARFSAISTYRELVPDFLRLFHRLEQDLEQFYLAVSAIASCSKPERRNRLQLAAPKNGCVKNSVN